mgnify:CR=1 FL=1
MTDREMIEMLLTVVKAANGEAIMMAPYMQGPYKKAMERLGEQATEAINATINRNRRSSPIPIGRVGRPTILRPVERADVHDSARQGRYRRTR